MTVGFFDSEMGVAGGLAYNESMTIRTITKTTIQVEAVFENGVLRPVEEIPLYNGERVTLAIEPHDEDMNHEFLAKCQADDAKRGGIAPTVEEIRELTKHDTSSWADLIIQERGEH